MKRLFNSILCFVLSFVFVLCSAFCFTGCGFFDKPGSNENGSAGVQGDKGDTGAQGDKGDKGDKGDTGAQGEKGDKGDKGDKGENGKSAYDIALELGFTGTKEEWLESLKGARGDDGKSVYDIAVELGFNGTKEEWLNSVTSTGNVATGYTPYIGTDGCWWIDGKTTDIRAIERDMDRKGTDGLIFRMVTRGGTSGWEVCDYDGTETDIVIPNYIYEIPVISISQDAFADKGIISLSISKNTVELPSFKNINNYSIGKSLLEIFDFNNASINEIPDGTFYYCTNLTTVKNYGNIKKIGKKAFANTALREFDFSNIKVIAEEAFAGCGYFNGRIVTKNGITAQEGFVYVPATVTEIGDKAFNEVYAVYFEENTTQNYGAKIEKHAVKRTSDGYYYKIAGNNCTLINYGGGETRIVVPSTLDGKAVTEISEYGFFRNMFIEKVELPSSLKKINEYAFCWCTKLSMLFVPECELDYYIGLGEDNVFGGIYANYDIFEITTVFFKAASVQIGNETIDQNSIKNSDRYKYYFNITPDRIKEDEICVYLENGDTYDIVTIKNKKGSVTVPATFNGKKIKRIQSQAASCGQYEFIDIENGIERISSYAFYHNENLVGVNIPKSVEIINQYGFGDCRKAVLCIESTTIPTDWDSSWYGSIREYKLNSKGCYSGEYVYRAEGDKIYLVNYTGEIEPEKVIIIPDSIDGKVVYGIDTKCFEFTETSSYSSKIEIIIPATVMVVAEKAFSYSRYGNANYYVYFSYIPEGWNANWHYSQYNNGSRYYTLYKLNEWNMVDGKPQANR